MKVADYSLSMQTSHVWSQQSSVQESLHVWVDPPRAPPAPDNVLVSISPAAQQKQSSEATAIAAGASTVTNDPNLQALIALIERLTGQKVRVFDASQLAAPQSAPPTPPHAAQQNAAPPHAGYGLDYSQTQSYSESEQTTLQASGVIKTSDGKEINFSLNLVMQRQYSKTSTTTVHAGDAARKTDPLVINFNGTAAQLSEQRFAFDLNADGQKELINAPASGSGFLALDKNGDGKINNGSELFGSGTGNGFSELAQYDSDHNGWIDENDAAFQKLKVWARDAAGNDKLSSLASLGVGAISLQAASTPFDIKTATNQLLGSVQSSSVAINENGTVGSVQQIDLIII
ncbi:MAG: VCBS repeat-containing protein [Nitrosomonadales bacterium]|nr:VCBS repeat-containing protein [Nitrosomonadales bacterium]